MKKIYIFLLSFLLISLNSIFAQTGTIQASIGPGSTPTRVKVYMRALTRPVPKATPDTISTLDFNVGFAASDYTTPPAVTVVSNVFGITWGVEAPLLEGGFWNYHIFKSVDIVFTFPDNVETQVMELELSGGAPATITSPLNVCLVTLTDGGSTQAAVFYCTGTINSNGSNLYYSRPSDGGYISSAINGFSYRPLGVNSTLGTDPSYVSIVAGPTPVKFLGFNVTKKNNDAVITWQIENESAITDRYEIERSLNGVDFKKVYTVTAKNNGSTANSYELTDLNLTSIRRSGVIYYRIKQFDKDGQFVTTAIKNLRLDGKSLAISVYPNPIKNYANVSIDLVEDARVMLTINDVSGKQVQTMPLQLFKGLNVKKVNMSGLAAGSYMLQVNTGTEIKTVPLVKAN